MKLETIDGVSAICVQLVMSENISSDIPDSVYIFSQQVIITIFCKVSCEYCGVYYY